MSIVFQLEDAYLRANLNDAEVLWQNFASTSCSQDTQLVVNIIRQRLIAQDYIGALHAARQATLYWAEDQSLYLRYKELDYLYGSDLEQQVVPVTDQMLMAGDACTEALLLDLKLYSHHITNTEVVKLLKVFVKRWPEHRPGIRLLLNKLQLEGEFEDIVILCRQRYIKRRKHESFMLQVWVHALVELQCLNEALRLAFEAHNQGELNKEIVEFLLVHSIGLGIASDQGLKSSLDTLCQACKLEGLEEAIRFELALKAPLRPLTPVFSPTQALTSSPRASADCLVVIFSGVARRFAVSLTLLDRFFAGYGVAVVHLVDKEDSYYLNGISGQGGSFESSVEKLREIAKGYGAKRIITFGHSAGGTAALHYGIALDASNILAYTPVGNLSIDFFDRHADYRNRPQIRKVNQVVSANRLDIKPHLERSNFKGQIDLYAGEYCVKDLVHVDYLSGMSQVAIHSVKDVAIHAVIAPAVLNGSFLQTLLGIVSNDSTECSCS
ncbi:hypothetical protein DN062_02625 [Nitrincola tibetensis]|uniref:Alpha/beta hydrolase n=1 Tax=Nitrincola tibetensis TaxID=2219697 RepID=A0A364NQ20_9GAMM|nr:hypothetical protein [Nitrincola tibetensis]RAU19181.1 hypothetical protein DN062_02625 [Nitrincola tibetensis]